MSQIFILGINKRLNKVFNMKQKFLILAVEKLYNSRLYISERVTKPPVNELDCD